MTINKYIAFHEIEQSLKSLFWGFLLTCLFFCILNYNFVNGIADYFQQLDNSKIESISNNICEVLQETNEETRKEWLGGIFIFGSLCKNENRNEGKSKIDNTDIELILAFGGGNYSVEQISKEEWKKLKGENINYLSSFQIHELWYKSFFYYPDRTFPTTEELANDLLSCRSFGIYLDDKNWKCPKDLFKENLGLNNLSKELQKKLTKSIDEVMNGTSQYDPGLRKQGIFSAYNMRRVWNGFIQWLTVWIALSGLVFLTNRIILYRRERSLLEQKIFVKKQNKLKLVEKKFANEPKIPLFFSDFLEQKKGDSAPAKAVAVNDKDFNDYVDNVNQNLYADSCARHFNIVRIVNTVNQACLSGKMDGIQVLDSEINQMREEMTSRGFFARFVVFAVPTIGFVGTVLGISDALGGADKVLSSETEPLQIAAIQAMTVNLSLAFDTTLVALLLSVPLILLSEFVTRREDENLTLAYQVIMDKNLEKITDAPTEQKVISTEEFETRVKGIIHTELESMLTQITDNIKEDTIHSLMNTLQKWSGHQADKPENKHESQKTTEG